MKTLSTQTQKPSPQKADATPGKAVAVIQARYRASRLPGKVLSDLGGEPMLWHVIRRVRRAAGVDAVLVATSDDASDDPIEAFCRARGVDVFRGAHEDVLDRFYHAAKSAGAHTIVRITADCPLIDPAIIDALLSRFHAEGADYASNTLVCTYPDGLDTEVFSFAALERAWKQAKTNTEREHVTPYMKSRDRFKHAQLLSRLAPDAAAMRWTVDTPEDLAFMSALFDCLERPEQAATEDIIRLIGDTPELRAASGRHRRDEGYYRSFLNAPDVEPTARSLERSLALKAQAQRLIPGITQTFSKGPSQFIQGVSPVFLERGSGSHVWDVDGNEYIDYIMALGPIVLGYADPSIEAAAQGQAKQGSILSLGHPVEIALAERLTRIIPSAQKVRFGKNGSDVTSAAVRAARAFTGREHIACCGYHGWQDWYIGTTARNKGVPQAVRGLTHTFVYNDIASLEALFAAHPGQIAAVILEPTGTEAPVPGFLEDVRRLCDAHQALLIFDEMVTGFRMHLGGAQTLFGVTPDLSCFGKAIANGYPLSAIVGRADIMDMFNEVFFSFTFGGETLSLAAACANIDAIESRGVIPQLWDLGRRLQDGYNVLARELGIERHTECVGWPVRNAIAFRDKEGREDLLLKSLFQQEVIKRGILCGGYHFVCAAHTLEDIDQTLRVYKTVLKRMAEAIASDTIKDSLQGAPVSPVFRRIS